MNYAAIRMSFSPEVACRQPRTLQLDAPREAGERVDLLHAMTHCDPPARSWHSEADDARLPWHDTF